MHSYLEILTELQETIEFDSIPKSDADKIKRRLKELFDLLWKYSD